jgi:hypothetical protein
VGEYALSKTGLGVSLGLFNHGCLLCFS